MSLTAASIDNGDGLSAEAISRDLFAGRLLAFTNLVPLNRLTARARELVSQHFGEGPETAEQYLDPADFRRTAMAARRAIASDPLIDDAWIATLADLGFAEVELWLDRMCLRVVPSNEATHGRIIRPLPPHRDSWASGLPAQVNWWLALYDLAPTRTMHLWPDRLATPVRNTAATWDYDVLREGSVKGYPLLPEALEEPAEPPQALIVPAGTLVAFASAHLHRSTSDASGITRFSLDTRTVWQRDIEAGRGAPEVDGSGKAPRWEMFERRGRSVRANHSSEN